MTASSVIAAVRSRLGDAAMERWSADTLLLYTSLAQNDICVFTRFYRKTVLISLIDSTLIYDLPTDCLAVNRLEYNHKMFPMESRNTIDSNTAVFPCVLKDNVAFNQLEIVLSNNEDDNLLLSALLIETYGVVVDNDNSGNPLSVGELEDEYGVVSEITEGSQAGATGLGNLTVFYTAVPALIALSEIGEAMIMPDIWFQAMVHFVTAMALQDDNDANNIQRGELEAQKYIRLLQRINQIASKDFTSNIPSKLTTQMQRI